MFQPIKYNELNARQKENYNFHKIAGLLADYGYNCLRLNDDWQGADLIAVHVDGEIFLRIQVKGRFVLEKKYERRNIHIAFLAGNDCYVYPHDEVLGHVLDRGEINETSSWRNNGLYSWPSLPKWAREILSAYKV